MVLKRCTYSWCRVVFIPNLNSINLLLEWKERVGAYILIPSPHLVLSIALNRFRLQRQVQLNIHSLYWR